MQGGSFNQNIDLFNPETKGTIDKFLSKKLAEYENVSLTATPETLDRSVWQLCQRLASIEDETKSLIEQLQGK